MKITAVCITNKSAPVEVRRILSFTKHAQAEILREICSSVADEAVVLSTCGRTEIYFVTCENTDTLAEYVCSLAGRDISDYLEIYEDSAAVRHLFMVTPGLESMVIGEDQILGQVKEAARISRENSCSGAYLNTLFRLAVTSAKKIKTLTKLSEIPVSVATIAVKACIKELGTLNGKNVLLTGASGQLGSIILKDITAVSDAAVYVTSRKRAPAAGIASGAVTVDYDKRYEYIDRADCVISVTSSPHYTYTADKLLGEVYTEKKRVFMDLAVPSDIERASLKNSVYYCIDDLEQLSRENNDLKAAEAKKAAAMTEEYIKEFEVRRLFYENRDIIEELKGTHKGFEKLMYSVMSEKKPEKFIRLLKSPEVYL